VEEREQVEQAVAGFRGEDRDALGDRHVAEDEAQLLQLLPQVFLDVGDYRRQVAGAEHGALEEVAALRIVGVLVERDDVRAVAGQHRGDRGDDPGAVFALDDQ
jgi:hypothetical protein